MRKPFIVLLLLTVLLLSFYAWAGSTTLIGSLVTVNGTTTSSSVALPTISPVVPGSFVIQNDGTLTNVNEVTINVQISLDNVNFVTIGTYHPSSTNVTSETFTPPGTNQPVFLRMQAVTTNAVGVSGIYIH